MSQTPYPAWPILIVDDERQVLESTERLLRFSGLEHVLTCPDPLQVESFFAKTEIGVVLLDLSMPGLSGEVLLNEITASYPDVPVIIVTGASEIDTAVRCMQAGSFDYMVKPVEKNRLLSGIRRALEMRELRRENRLLSERLLSDTLEHPEHFSRIITANATMLSIFRYVETIAKSPRPVLITGETGVGKERFAEAVHLASGRSGAFVAINAAGLDDALFSDTIFGHVRGAFTGADTHRRGLIEQAANGTLFLDEIGDLSAASQVKLLRLVQEREYLPLGAEMPRHSDARIITATNHDLTSGFRKDLYHRLQTHHIHIPPLRERIDDLPLLVDHFLELAAHALEKRKPTPPQELITLLSTYRFPGNVRELESMVFESVTQHKSRILATSVFRQHIERESKAQGLTENSSPLLTNAPLARLPQLPTLRQGAEMLIAEAMRRANGNQTVAARLLGISRTALNKRLNYTMSPESIPE